MAGRFLPIDSARPTRNLTDTTLRLNTAGLARKHLLLGFGTTGACFREMRDLGFPQAYAHLGEEFETGEVTMDRHEELARIYNVSTSSCNTFIFVPKCVSSSCCAHVYNYVWLAGIDCD